MPTMYIQSYLGLPAYLMQQIKRSCLQAEKISPCSSLFISQSGFWGDRTNFQSPEQQNLNFLSSFVLDATWHLLFILCFFLRLGKVRQGRYPVLVVDSTWQEKIEVCFPGRDRVCIRLLIQSVALWIYSVYFV